MRERLRGDQSFVKDEVVFYTFIQGLSQHEVTLGHFETPEQDSQGSNSYELPRNRLEGLWGISSASSRVLILIFV